MNQGVYYDTLLSISACDSIIISQITVNNSSTTLNPQSICDGETYIINNNAYYLAGSYYDIFADNHGNAVHLPKGVLCLCRCLYEFQM